MTQAARQLPAHAELIGAAARYCQALREAELPLWPRGTPAAEGLPELLTPYLDEDLARQDAQLQAPPDAEPDRLSHLVRQFDLDAFDTQALLIALAPDLRPATGATFAALQEGTHSATTSLVLILTGMAAHNGSARHRLGSDGSLVRYGLIELGGTEQQAPLGRTVRVPTRVQDFLLGIDVPPRELTRLLSMPPPIVGPAADQLSRGLAAGIRVAYVRDRHGGVGAGAAVAAFHALGGYPIVLDAQRLGTDTNRWEAAIRTAAREALLRGGGLVVSGIEDLTAGGPEPLRTLMEQPGPMILVGRDIWEPRWAREVPLTVTAERIDTGIAMSLWDRTLGAEDSRRVQAAEVTRSFQLSPEELVRAGQLAQQLAAAAGRELTAEDVQAGARAQNSAELSRLARRVTPEARWSDLVLPAPASAEVREIASRWRYRDEVLDRWGLRRGGGRGRGVTALFTGAPGTGKTLAAETIAGELGLDLYVVELSMVVDKYIGETSKNLERIFDAADRVNGVLLFDEADALFGKRSGVSDAKDRHANIEVAYLLQRMESFDGIAILTTNLAANLDEAFLRRLDAIVDFPSPDVTQRRQLWETILPETAPRDAHLDLADLAERFPLTGAEIRNVATTAAYRAAATGTSISTELLLQATIREYRKLGRHLTEYDLGPWAHLLAAS